MCERRYRVGEQWYNLRPDALAAYRVGQQHFRFWLEWDCGTMNVRDLSIKFASYAHFIASREWAREAPRLPRLFCVAPDIAQEKRIQRVTGARLEQTLGLVMCTTTEVLLNEHGLLCSYLDASHARVRSRKGNWFCAKMWLVRERAGTYRSHVLVVYRGQASLLRHSPSSCSAECLAALQIMVTGERGTAFYGSFFQIISVLTFKWCKNHAISTAHDGMVISLRVSRGRGQSAMGR